MKFIVSTNTKGTGRKICVIIKNIDCTYKNITRDILQSLTDYYVTLVEGLIKSDIKKHKFNDLASAIRFLQEFKFYHHHRVTEVTYDYTIIPVPQNWILDLWHNRIYITPGDPNMVATDDLIEACRLFLQTLLGDKRKIYIQRFLADYKKGVCFYFIDPTLADHIEEQNLHIATSKKYNFIQPVILGESCSRHYRQYYWDIYDKLVETILEEPSKTSGCTNSMHDEGLK